jgi:hypothetical protein
MTDAERDLMQQLKAYLRGDKVDWPELYRAREAVAKEWAGQNPGHSERETTNAAKAKFPGERITRQMIRDLLKPPDGNPRPRGKKPGKSYSEHAQRMRS